MPGMSGQEVLEAIRDRGYGCMVAMLTVVEPDIDIIKIGFDKYLHVSPQTRVPCRAECNNRQSARPGNL